MDKDEVVRIDEDEERSAQMKPQPRSCAGIFATWFLSFWAALFSIFLVPFITSVFILNPQEEAVVLFWGKLHKVYKTPGVHWYNVLGRDLIKMSTRTQTLDIKKTTVVDANGNPIIVSGVVTFKIVDSLRAAFSVSNVNDFMERQAMATLKKVCSRYPYESKDGISLHTEADQVSKEMVSALQNKATICGVRVLTYELADLQYAPEIAQGMLVRQQAQALLDARKVVVDGAVSIVTTAVLKLGESGIKLSNAEQSRLVSNLLAVICSDAKVQPMFSISESVNQSQEILLK